MQTNAVFLAYDSLHLLALRWGVHQPGAHSPTPGLLRHGWGRRLSARCAL